MGTGAVMGVGTEIVGVTVAGISGVIAAGRTPGIATFGNCTVSWASSLPLQ